MGDLDNKNVRSRKGKGKKVTKPRRTKNQKIKLAKKICREYSEGFHTIESICLSYEVPYRTFKSWATEGERGFVAEVADTYKKAQDESENNFKQKIRNQARQSLLKLLTWESVIETHTTKRFDKEGNLIGKTIKTIEKTNIPPTNAVIFALVNVDKENFSNNHSRREPDVIKKKEIDPLDSMTLEELQIEIDKYEKIIEEGDKAREDNNSYMVSV